MADYRIGQRITYHVSEVTLANAVNSDVVAASTARVYLAFHFVGSANRAIVCPTGIVSTLLNGVQLSPTWVSEKFLLAKHGSICQTRWTGTGLGGAVVVVVIEGILSDPIQ